MLLLLTDFEKGFVRTHTRKSGTVVQSHFTKRLPGKVQEKHLKERFYDHDKSGAKKAHEELETKKAHHQSVLNAVKKHHDELTKQGPGKDEEGIPHKTKIEHLKAEIKNQETHIDNHSRKQEHIKNRYEISSKQIVRKKSKADLEKRIKDHSDEQKNTIRNIHKAHQEGRSNLEPGKVLTGKDKDHIYLESKHKDTGKTHHIAIHKDGSVKDPQILHGGKFDHKTLEEERKEKKVPVKKPTEPVKLEIEKEVPKEEPKLKKRAVVAKKPIEKPVVKKEKPPVKEEKKPEPEKPKREPKKVVVKKEKPEEKKPKKAVKKEVPKDKQKIKEWEEKGTDSKAFKEWFGDSKIVDKKGKPLVAYHGTSYTNIKSFLPKGGEEDGKRALDIFRKAKESNAPFGYLNFRSGSFFSPDPKYAENYADEGKGTIYPVYLKAESPIYIDSATLKVKDPKPKKTPDALIMMDGDKINEIAVIDPTQIKSIFNEGTFSPESEEMSKSASELKKSILSEAKEILKQEKGEIRDLQKSLARKAKRKRQKKNKKKR